MATFRDIDHNTRINGSLLVGQPSTFLDDLEIQGILSLGAIADVEAELNSKVSKDSEGNVVIVGSLDVQGGITGIDLSQYYTKVDLNTSAGSGQVHWDNLIEKKSATTESSGIVRLSSLVTSTSTELVPTAKLLNDVYLLANSKWTWNQSEIEGVKVNDSLHADNADTVNNLTVETAVPPGALFTDTIYTHPSSHSIAFIDNLQQELDDKVDQTQVLTNVPAGAVFTDTVTSINGQTGVIAKEDIVALGIPAQDTIYTHPATHPIDMIEETTDLKVMTSSERAAISSLESNFYTQISLGTSGQASVHWDNLTNRPSLDNYVSWTLKANGEASGINIGSGDILNIEGSGETSVSRSGSTIIIESSETIYTAGDGLSKDINEFNVNLGSGLGLDGENIANTDKGSSQNIWKNISDGTSSISASLNNDTLTIEGSGVISTSASSKTLTIGHEDSDHTSFVELAGENVMSGRLVMQTNQAPTEVTTRQAKTFVGDDIALETSVDALTETIYKASTGTEVWEKDVDYTINYKTGIITRISDGGIPSGGTIYVTYTPTIFVFKVKGGTSDTTDYLQIDNKGNIYGKSMTVNLTSSQSSTSNDVQGDFIIQGNLNVNGQTVFGNDNTDVTRVNGKLVLYQGTTKVFEVDNNGIIQTGTIGWDQVLNKVDGTTLTKGIVQLSDSLTSNSSSTAATSKAVYLLNNAVNTKWEWSDNELSTFVHGLSIDAATVSGFTIEKDLPLGAELTDTVTRINGKTGDITKADIVALGIPSEQYEHDLTHPLSMITETDTLKVMTLTERNKLASISDSANNYTLETHTHTHHSDIDQSLLKTDTVEFGAIGINNSTPDEAVDVAGSVRIREDNSLKFGGTGSGDAECEIKFNPQTRTIDFNFLT